MENQTLKMAETLVQQQLQIVQLQAKIIELQADAMSRQVYEMMK